MSRLSQMLNHQANKSGLSEREISRRHGWKPASFGHWKTARSVPTSMFFPQVAKFLGVTLEQLEELVEEAKISRHVTKIPPATQPISPPLAHPVIADRKVGKFRFDEIPRARYSFKVDTKVMEPALLVGKSATADPVVRPNAGHDVLVFGKAGNAWIGQLQSRSVDPVDGSVAVITRHAGATLTIKDVQVVHVLVSSDRA